MNIRILFIAAVFCTLGSCDESLAPDPEDLTPPVDIVVETFEGTVAEALARNLSDHEEAGDYLWDAPEVVSITLNGNSIDVDGPGATVDGRVVTIMPNIFTTS